MAKEHGAYKSVLGKGYFVLGYRVGPKDLKAIRKKLRCWRRSKLLRLVKLAAWDFECRVKNKVNPPAFGYFCLGEYCLVFGKPASAEEIEREFPEGVDCQDHVIKLAI